jgi:hypothetical protein
MSLRSWILFVLAAVLPTVVACTLPGVCPATGDSSFTPESLQADIPIDDTSAFPVGALLRFGVTATESGHQQTCNDTDEEDDRGWGCCQHLGTESASRDASGTMTITSVSCEGSCDAWVDPSEPSYVEVVGSDVGTGTIVANVTSDNFSTTVRVPIVFDVAKSLRFTQFDITDSAKYVFLEGSSFTWCVSAMGRAGMRLAAEFIDVTTSGPIAAGDTFDTSDNGGPDHTCVSFKALAKGHAVVDWKLAGVEAQQGVDIVSLDDVGSIELVTVPSINQEYAALDTDVLAGIGPTTDVAFPPLRCISNDAPELVVRFHTEDGRTGIALTPTVTVDPPSLLQIGGYTFISAGGTDAPGTTGTLTARFGAATTQATVQITTCAQGP